MATLLLALSVSACGTGIKTVELPRSTSAQTGPQSLDAALARISIRSPQPGSTVAMGPVTVIVDVQGFNLVNPGSRPRLGAGHIVYYLGSKYEVPVAAGRPATAGGTDGRGPFVSYSSAKTRYRWSIPTRGTASLAVQLVSSDNLPLDPPQVARVTVTVR